MASERLTLGNVRYAHMQSELSPSFLSSPYSFHAGPDQTWIFEELPKARIVSVSRPDAGDISPIQLSYTIEFEYKQEGPIDEVSRNCDPASPRCFECSQPEKGVWK